MFAVYQKFNIISLSNLGGQLLDIHIKQLNGVLGKKSQIGP